MAYPGHPLEGTLRRAIRRAHPGVPLWRGPSGQPSGGVRTRPPPGADHLRSGRSEGSESPNPLIWTLRMSPPEGSIHGIRRCRHVGIHGHP